MIPLALVVGEGPRFGTGHAVRMRELRAILVARGLVIDEWHTVGGFDAADASWPQVRPESLVILDARDLDPRPFVEQGARVLALDNRHACREASRKSAAGAIEFYDTLPHPRANLRDTLQRVLLAADVRALAEADDGITAADASRAATSAGNQPPTLFVYSGDFAIPLLDDALLRSFEGGWSVHRCGSAPPTGEFARRLQDRDRSGTERLDASGTESRDADASRNSLCYSTSLKRAEFIRELAAADRVWTYFGMTLLEAWHLRRECSMLPVASPVHSELVDYLHQAAGLAVVPPASVSASGADAFVSVRSPVPDLRPGGRGFELLIERIRALVPDM